MLAYKAAHAVPAVHVVHEAAEVMFGELQARQGLAAAAFNARMIPGVVQASYGYCVHSWGAAPAWYW